MAGSTQLEYVEGEYLYRDVYYTGPYAFVGIETIYHQSKPVWSMVYPGDWGAMIEEEIDNILRPALIENAQTARTNQRVEWIKDNFRYLCGGEVSLDNFSVTETLFSGGKPSHRVVYYSAVL